MSVIKDFITRYGVLVQGDNAVTSSTGQTGALQVDGGAAIAKNLIVGDSITVYGPLNVKNSSIFDGLVQFNNFFTVTNTVYFNDLNVGGYLRVAGATTLTGTLNAIGLSTFNNTSTFNATLIVTGSNKLIVGTGLASFGGPISIAGVASFSNTTPASAGSIGSIVVAGGAFIGNNLYVNSNAANTVTNTSNSLYVAGGAWIDRSLVVGGDTLFKGNVTFNGTSTYVYSTNTVYTDNILELHVPPGGIGNSWTYDDGKDIGIRLHYFTEGTYTNAALVLANDTKYLEWYSAGAEGSNTFTGSSYGTFKTGNILLVGSTTATSTQTGSLQVAGGVGIGGNLYVGSDISGKTVSARNLTQGRIVLSGSNGLLIDDAELTYDPVTNLISAASATANTSTNIAGGGPGQIVYQTSTGTTGFVITGTSGYLLQSNGKLAPTWIPISEIFSGFATTSTNIANGTAGQLVYQTGPGSTSFVGPGNPGQLLQSNGASAPTYVNTGNIYVGNSVFTDNVKGGILGSIPYQAASGVTQFINVGDAGSLLQSNGTTATFVNTSSISVGSALFASQADKWSIARTISLSGDLLGFIVLDGTANVTFTASVIATVGNSVTATNLANGDAGQIPYQTSTGTTTFTDSGTTGQILVSRGSAGPVFQSTLTLAGNTESTSTQSGALVVGGGAGIGGNIYVGGKLVVNDLTDSTSTGQGSVVISGGVGISKGIVVGGDLTVGLTTSGSVISAIYTNNILLASYTSPVITSNVSATIDIYDASMYRTARYTVQIVDGVAIHITEIVVSHNNTTAYINQYGVITNNGELGSFDAIISNGNLVLTFVPFSASSMTIKVVRFGITA